MPFVDENGDEWFDFFDRADMERFDEVVDAMAADDETADDTETPFSRF